MNPEDRTQNAANTIQNPEDTVQQTATETDLAATDESSRPAAPGRRKRRKSGGEGGVDYEVASQWQLMWWKFKKHRMATIAGPVLIALYVVAFTCEFFSPSIPTHRFPDYTFAPPSRIRFVDVETGEFSLRPFVYDITRSTDPDTFRRTYSEVPGEKYYIHLFVRGRPYQFWGFIPGTIRLFGARDQDAPFFLLGTDHLGRDMFTRILYGARISLSFGIMGIFFTLIIGLILGGLSGYLGGVVDTVIQRLIDLLLCIPTIPLWMALAAALPRTWGPIQIYFGMILIFSIIGWTSLGRVVRGKMLSLREEDFTLAARMAGAKDGRIIRKHLLPSFMSYIIVSITLSIPQQIIGETSLSFLGLGLQPPVVSWGVLLQNAQNIQTLAHHPWLLWPAAFVILAVLMFNFLGDGLRDAADPYK